MSASLPMGSLEVGVKRGLPYLSWGAYLVLLIAEVLALTLRFDSDRLIGRPGWLAALLAHSHWFTSLGICVGLVLGLVLLGSVQGDREWWWLAAASGTSRRVWPWLASHLAMYAGFAWLTRLIFEAPALAAHPAPWLALWIAAGLATLVLWLGAVLPFELWYRLVQTRWKVLLLGLFASAVAVVAGQSTSTLWTSFHRSTFDSVRAVLSLFYREVFSRPDEYIVGTPAFDIEITSECSGFEGIGLIWVFLGVFYWLFRHELRFPQALVLIPLGTVLSWVGNVARIAALVALGDWGWPEVAVGGFHSQAGWLAFNGIGLGLVVLARRVRWFSKVETEPAATVNPTSVYLGPLVAIALTMMITGAFSERGFDRFYAARVLAGLAVFAYYRRHYAALSWSWSWHAVAIGLVVSLIWMALEPAPESLAVVTAIPDSLAEMPRFWAAAWLAARVIGSVAVIPLAEELAFRGYLTRRLISADFLAVPEGRFTWPSFLLSSLLFGLLHQRWLAGMLAGMLYALAYYRRGKLSDSVLAHATTNLLITMSVLSTGEWHKWS